MTDEDPFEAVGERVRARFERMIASGAAEHPDDEPLFKRRREIMDRLEARKASAPRAGSAGWGAHAVATSLAQVQQHSPYNEAAQVELAEIESELRRRRAARLGGAA